MNDQHVICYRYIAVTAAKQNHALIDGKPTHGASEGILSTQIAYIGFVIHFNLILVLGFYEGPKRNLEQDVQFLTGKDLICKRPHSHLACKQP